MLQELLLPIAVEHYFLKWKKMATDFFIEFLQLQRSLFAAYEKVHPHATNNNWLIGVPSSTMIKIDSGEWEAIKHGGGVRFKRINPAPHIVVDAHNYFGLHKRIDALRWHEFMESKGFQSSYESALQQLENAVDRGVLFKTDHSGYSIE
jgi:hypothetical protein